MSLADALLPYTPRDPLLGGTFGIGPANLPQIPGATAFTRLPPPPISGLASQVPVGAGRSALTAANALRPAASTGSSILSRLPSFARPGPANMTKGAGLAGLGYGIAGSVGSNLIDRINPGGQNSNIEQGLQGVAQGAGIGAGIGAMFGGVGAGPGALIGGAAGGALGVLGNVLGFGGGGGEAEAPDPLEILTTGIQRATLTPDQTEEILSTYEVLTALAENQPEGEARDAAMQQAFDAASQMILQAMQEEEAAAAQGTNLLALQAQAQDIFAPLAQDIRASGEMYANAMRGLSADLPEEYRAIANYQTARELNASQRLAAAYQAQAAVTPAINQMAQYQQDYNSLAAQTWQQALAGQVSGATSPAQQDVAAMLLPG